MSASAISPASLRTSCSGRTVTAVVMGMRSVTEATLTASMSGFGFIRMFMKWCSGTVSPQ